MTTKLEALKRLESNASRLLRIEKDIEEKKASLAGAKYKSQKELLEGQLEWLEEDRKTTKMRLDLAIKEFQA